MGVNNISAFKEGLQELYIYLKDRLLRHSLLVKTRTMFWLEQSPYNKSMWEVKVPVGKFKTMTHRELFAHLQLLGIDVSLEKTIRGYYNPKNGVIRVYSGVEHGMPDNHPSHCNFYAFLTIYNYFKDKGITEFGVGSVHSRYRTFIGKDWDALFELDLRALELGKCVWIKKVSLK